MSDSSSNPPPGHLRSVVTYLQMLGLPDRPLRPPPRDELAIVRAAPPSVAFYRFLYNTVGEPWLWHERRRWPDDRLRREIEDPDVEVHVLYDAGSPAGYAELDLRQTPDVELRYFGVMPECIGRGLGPYLLDWTIDHVWRRGAGRYWLHTCTLDHPAALGVYRRAGFEPYDERVEIVRDPRPEWAAGDDGGPSEPAGDG